MRQRVSGLSLQGRLDVLRRARSPRVARAAKAVIDQQLHAVQGRVQRLALGIADVLSGHDLWVVRVCLCVFVCFCVFLCVECECL